METLSAPTDSSLRNWPGADIQQTDILNKGFESPKPKLGII